MKSILREREINGIEMLFLCVYMCLKISAFALKLICVHIYCIKKTLWDFLVSIKFSFNITPCREVLINLFMSNQAAFCETETNKSALSQIIKIDTLWDCILFVAARTSKSRVTCLNGL